MKRFERSAPQHGFTLTELVMVIVLIGILAAVAIPNFSGVTDDAKKSKASAIFGSLKASYATQKAIKKGGAVSVSDIVAGHDPGCTGSGTARTCPAASPSAYVVFGGNVDDVTALGWTCNVDTLAGPSCL